MNIDRLENTFFTLNPLIVFNDLLWLSKKVLKISKYRLKV